MIRFLIILFLLFMIACGEGSITPPGPPIHSYISGSVTLSWDANIPSDNILEYRLYRSTVSGVYPIGEPFIILDESTISYTVTTGVVGIEYFFVVTAFNGLESEVSNEVSKIY